MGLFLVKVVRTSTLLVEADNEADVMESLTGEANPVDLLDVTDYDLDVEIQIVEEIDPKLGRHIDGFVYEKTFFFADAPMPDEVEAGMVELRIQAAEAKKNSN